MYTPYLICGYVGTLFFLLIGFRVVRRTSPDLRGQAHLHRYILCAIFALLCLGPRSWAPLLLTIILPNLLLFAGAAFLYLGACDILQVPPRFLSWQINVCLAGLPPLLWFTYVQPSVLGRLFCHALVMAALTSVTAGQLFRHRDPVLRSPLRASAWLLTSLAGVQIAWLAASIVHPPSTDFMHTDLIGIAFSYLSVLLGASNVAALMWLSLCVHRSQLHQMAQTDALTGLLNRRAFEEIVRRELPRSGRHGRSVGLLLIDVDHFKRVNDSMGHLAGDEVLRRISGVLRESTRVSDVLARYGGEEFVVLLRDAGLDESSATAERIRSEIASLSNLPGDLSLTASIGVAIGNASESAAGFLLRSDEALYRAKRGGRNLVSIHPSCSAQPVPVV